MKITNFTSTLKHRGWLSDELIKRQLTLFFEHLKNLAPLDLDTVIFNDLKIIKTKKVLINNEILLPSDKVAELIADEINTNAIFLPLLFVRTSKAISIFKPVLKFKEKNADGLIVVRIKSGGNSAVYTNEVEISETNIAGEIYQDGWKRKGYELEGKNTNELVCQFCKKVKLTYQSFYGLYYLSL